MNGIEPRGITPKQWLIAQQALHQQEKKESTLGYNHSMRIATLEWLKRTIKSA